VREIRSPGSVRGAARKGRPYRDQPQYSGERLAGMGESDSGRVYSLEEGRPEAGAMQARRAHRMAAGMRLGREERLPSGVA
jgi:hypothetical protein